MYRPSNQEHNYLTIISFIVFFLLLGCSSSQRVKLNSKLNQEPLNHSFHGLVVVDAKTNKTRYAINGDRYFTPASNVKIFALYTGIMLLPDSIPTLKYSINKDTVHFEGTGDPSWLHPHFKDSTALNFLKKHTKVAWNPHNTTEDRYGPGWAWEDYDTYFSPEKNALPLYGNVLTVSNTNGLEVSPPLFRNKVEVSKKSVRRDEFTNRFYISPTVRDTLQVPFITGDTLTKQLLEHELGMEVLLTDQVPPKPKKVLYGIPADSLYKQILHKSDNFLAEQLLMMASSTLSDTLSTQRAISHVLENYLNDLQHKPRWVDGSGLSRYNLFTPTSMVQVLQQLYAKIPEERLFHLFPMWDASGTLDIWHNPNSEPFIFAKSGSLGNNYNLSGYLKTKSGKLLIFSFMNNHFRVSTSVIRMQIYETLKSIHQKY